MKRRPRILLVDDDTDITTPLRTWLNYAGFDVEVAANGEEGLALKETFQPDVIILDIKMPVMDGFEMLRRLRNTDKIIRVIVLSVLDDQIIEALGEGADSVFAKKSPDNINRFANIYLDKPYTAPELLAYIRRHLKDRDDLTKMALTADRSQSAVEQPLEVIIRGQLAYDPNSDRFRLKGKELKLTRLESDLLRYMMENPDRLLTREGLLNTVWNDEYKGPESEMETRAVDNRIRSLRQKLGDTDLNKPKYIYTEFGKGYRFIPQ